MSRVSMLCSSTRFFFQRNPSIAVIHASLRIGKQLSSSTKLTLFRSCSISSISSATKVQFLRPISCNLRSESTMASQSKSGSIYDFTVKVRFILMFPVITVTVSLTKIFFFLVIDLCIVHLNFVLNRMILHSC